MRRILPRVWSSRSMTSVAAFGTRVSGVIVTLRWDMRNRVVSAGHGREN